MTFDLRKVSADDASMPKNEAMPVERSCCYLWLSEVLWPRFCRGNWKYSPFDGAGCGCAARALSDMFDYGAESGDDLGLGWASTMHC